MDLYRLGAMSEDHWKRRGRQKVTEGPREVLVALTSNLFPDDFFRNKCSPTFLSRSLSVGQLG